MRNPGLALTLFTIGCGVVWRVFKIPTSIMVFIGLLIFIVAWIVLKYGGIPLHKIKTPLDRYKKSVDIEVKRGKNLRKNKSPKLAEIQEWGKSIGTLQTSMLKDSQAKDFFFFFNDKLKKLDASKYHQFLEEYISYLEGHKVNVKYNDLKTAVDKEEVRTDLPIIK